MKIIKNIIIAFSLLGALMACNDLNIPPVKIIQDDDIFSTEPGITAFMARLYEELPMEDFKFNATDGFGKDLGWPALSNYCGEIMMCTCDINWNSPNGDLCKWWGYESVRNVNYFLKGFPLYENLYSEEQKNAWLGEAHFIRAYYYFALVKRYGGIPIITTIQSYPEQSLEELSVKRNTEKEVYDFIAQELDEAIKLLPEKIAAGRTNKNVAYALKSKVMLYAGSIAQYGKIQLDGLLGIPSENAKSYYEASYAAAKALEGKYSLYNKYTDKTENYWHLFLDEADNREVIFYRPYQYPEKVHSFDAHHIPFQMRGSQGYSSRFNPTLDIVEMFDDIDGNSDWLEVNDKQGNPKRFDNITDLFKNAEPRLRGSVIFPQDEYKGEKIDVQKGLYTSYPNGELMTTTNSNEMYKDKKITGLSGIGNGETTSTGFYLRKYQNPEMPLSILVQGRSEQDYIDIRYAEILLNRAEAAFQLGLKEDALSSINAIRERAGAKLYTSNQLTEESIRKERRTELAFENQTFWDLRRWRISDSEMNNKEYRALCPYYIFDEDKYIFKKEIVGGRYTFDVQVYYFKIPDEERAKNHNLEQNPGY